MADHRRNAIIKQIVADLSATNRVVGADTDVIGSERGRYHALDRKFADNPDEGLNLVYFESEEVVDSGSTMDANRVTINRSMMVVIECCANANYAEIDEFLDQQTVGVEAVMGARDYSPAGALGVYFVGTDSEIENSGTNAQGRLKLTYRVLYRTDLADPTDGR